MAPTSRSRFLGVSFSSSSPPSTVNGGELNEDDVLWTNDDFSQHSPSAVASAATNQINHNLGDRRPSFHKNSGIFAALSEPDRQPVIHRKSSLGASSSKAIPKPPPPPPLGDFEYEYKFSTASQTMPAGAMRKMNQSAPMNVPVLSAAMAKERAKKWYEEEGDEHEGEEEMLPPHEIVARGSRKSPKTTFSVLEGVGRTLKGRDLRQVRNAVWRKTGFLD